MLNLYEFLYDWTRKKWPFNTGDCLIEVTAWAGLTVYKYLYTEDNLHKLILYIHNTYFCNGHGIYNLFNSVHWMPYSDYKTKNNNQSDDS